MMLAEIEKLLREEIGLHAETVGGSVVQYALKQRMAACRLSEPADYWRLLTSSRQELQELVNAVVIPETWFFRDREAFAAMVRHARANRRAGSPVRLLSMPCSTGEEPYSIAMTVVETQGADAVVELVCSDIDTEVLEHARRGVYAADSRGLSPARLRRHFLRGTGANSGLIRVRRELARLPSFRVFNLMSADWSSLGAPFDFVFCRNVMIYFDEAEQKRLIAKFYRCLKPGGYLFVGHAESLFGLSDQFRLVHINSGTAYQRIEA
jgi:chemotaxis methyl-accepting protein methylase